MRFTTQILQTGNNTGIEITESQLDNLGGGKKPLVNVTINDHTYPSAVGKMGGKFMISLSAENRTKAGVLGGETVEVTLELDTAPRTVEIPEDLQQALIKSNKQAQFDGLAPSKKKAIVLSLKEAKTAETRSKRIAKTVESLA